VDATDWCVLFVGSGFERKGLGPLVDGLASIGDRRARLVVAGRGNHAAYGAQAVRLGLGDRVAFIGLRPDVDRLYAAADLVALPARYEPFGNVHLEALASGVPVLSSVHAGGAELIRNGVNGWVVTEVSGPRIADGLERLRSADAKALAVQARASAEPYPYSAQAEHFEALYRRNPAFH
jgi:UDP-glucose:(heptosyl)LPS alpha-1,3-glucosyltransferase